MLQPASIPCCRTLILLMSLLLAPVAAPAATVHLSGPPGASVRIDGKDVGMLPLPAPLELAAGVYDIEARARGFSHFEQVLVVGAADGRINLKLRLMPLTRGNAIKGSAVYAGLGQWYVGAKIRGWIYFLGETGGLVTALGAELQRSNYKNDFLNYKASYDQSFVADDIQFYQEQTNQAFANMQSAEDLRNNALLVALGAYAVSLLDAWLLFPSVDIGPGLVPPTRSLAMAPSSSLGNGPSSLGNSLSSSVSGLHAAVAFGF